MSDVTRRMAKSDTQVKATPIDLEGISDEQCRKILDAIETARTLGFNDGHLSARREAVNSHDKLLEALKGLTALIRDVQNVYGVSAAKWMMEKPSYKAAEAAIQSAEDKPNAG